MAVCIPCAFPQPLEKVYGYLMKTDSVYLLLAYPTGGQRWNIIAIDMKTDLSYKYYFFKLYSVNIDVMKFNIKSSLNYIMNRERSFFEPPEYATNIYYYKLYSNIDQSDKSQY